MVFDLGGDPGLDGRDEVFEKANVVEGEVEDALNRKGQGGIKGEALLSDALELASVVERVGKAMMAEFVELKGEVFNGKSGELVQAGLLGEDKAAGGAKDVGEGFEAVVGGSSEEEKGGEVALLAGEVLDEVKAKAGVEAKGEGVIRSPGGGRAARAGAFGDVEGVPLVALVVFGEGLLEPLDPTGVEEEEVEVVGLEVRIISELEKEGEPEEAGGFARDVDAVEGVGVDSLEEELFGERVAGQGVGEGAMGLEGLTVREEETEISLLVTEINANL